MMTNVIAYLHTTFAYQSAAVQLMAGQANFAAAQLHLQEPLPIVVPANTNNWRVAMPPEGVTGVFITSNYVYSFNLGRLVAIQRKPQPRGAAVTPAEPKPSLIDTNDAYELARQWLAALSVDVPALESKYPHSVVQLTTRSPASRLPAARERGRGSVTTRVDHATNRTANDMAGTPQVFRVTWGGGRGSQALSARTAQQVSLEILGSTKQCLGLRIQNPRLFTGPPLQVTNAAALLGPPPPPQHFVEAFLGGKAAYDTVASPDRVAAWLLSTQTDEPESKTNRTPAVSVDVNTAALFSRTLTDFNSYSWLEEKGCTPDYGVRLRFTKGGENVEFLLAYGCDHLQVTHNGQSAEKDCDAAHAALVRAIQSVFPRDEVIKNLSLLNSSQTK